VGYRGCARTDLSECPGDGCIPLGHPLGTTSRRDPTNLTIRQNLTRAGPVRRFARISRPLTEGPAVQFDVCRTGIRAGAAPGGPGLPPRTWVMRGGCLSLCGMALRPLELLVGAALRLRPVVLTTMTHIMHVSPCLRVGLLLRHA
jgi:hypothetical protein